MSINNQMAINNPYKADDFEDSNQYLQQHFNYSIGMQRVALQTRLAEIQQREILKHISASPLEEKQSMKILLLLEDL